MKMKYHNISLLLVITISLSITMCETDNDFSEYKKLQQHSGTINYEVATVFPKEYQIHKVLIDTTSKQLNVSGNTNPVNKDEGKGGRRKISKFGEVLDEGPIFNILKDGTLLSSNTYYNWVSNGDKSGHIFEVALRTHDIEDSSRWLEKFIELYDKAQFVK